MIKKSACCLAAALLFLLLSLSAVAIILGDCDGDGKILASDARFALRASVGLETAEDEVFSATDANHDLLLTAADARLILRVAVGLCEFEHPLDDRATEISRIEPSCVADGSVTYLCSCGMEISTLLSAVGHTVSPYRKTIKKATCCENGSEAEYCVDCGEILTVYPTAVTKHTYSTDYAVVTPSTADKFGYEARFCDVCGYEDGRIIPKRAK